MAWYDFFTDVGKSAENFWDSFFGDDTSYSTGISGGADIGGSAATDWLSESELIQVPDDPNQTYSIDSSVIKGEESDIDLMTFGDFADQDAAELALASYIANPPEMADDSSVIEDLIEKAKGIGPLAKAAKGILEAGGIGGKRGSQAPSTSRRGSPTAPSAREQRMKEAGRIAGSLTAPSGRGTSAAQMFARQNKVDVSQILASLTDPKASGPNIKLIVGNKLNVSRTA